MKMTKLKFILASLLMIGSMTAGSMTLGYASSLKGDACAGLNTLATGSTNDTSCGSSGESSIKNIVSEVVKILSLVVGIASIIVIIIAGLNFVTAGGDASKVSSAKNTLIYALIGVVIAVSAQFLVHFALNTSAKATTCPSDSSLTVADPACRQ